jgi:hypothetical protein
MGTRLASYADVGRYQGYGSIGGETMMWSPLAGIGLVSVFTIRGPLIRLLKCLRALRQLHSEDAFSAVMISFLFKPGSHWVCGCRSPVGGESVHMQSQRSQKVSAV